MSIKVVCSNQDSKYNLMNVKKLKELYEKQGLVKPELKSKPSEKRQNPIFSSFTAPEIDIATIAHSKTPEPERNHQNFLEELNKKIARNSEASSDIMKQSKNRVYRANVIESDPQNELCMEDILNGDKTQSSRQSTVKVRYGINEKDANKLNSNIFEDYNMEQFQQDKDKVNNSFFQTLQNMLQTFNKSKTAEPLHSSSDNIRKSKIINKNIYDNLYDNKESKLQRVDFVINVIFGSIQFQSIPPESKMLAVQKETENNEYLDRNTFGKGTVERKQEAQEIKPSGQKDIFISQILEKTMIESEQKSEGNKEYLTWKRPSMAKNPLFNELSMRIKQKQEDQAKKTRIEPKMSQPTYLHSSQKSRQRSLTPRQKKKPKAKQLFDDN